MIECWSKTVQGVPPALSAVAREEERLTLAGAFGGSNAGGDAGGSGTPRFVAEPAGGALNGWVDMLRVSESEPGH